MGDGDKIFQGGGGEMQLKYFKGGMEIKYFRGGWS